jgi:hypothetical protein
MAAKWLFRERRQRMRNPIGRQTWTAMAWLTAAGLGLLAGCQNGGKCCGCRTPAPPHQGKLPVMVAKATATPITVDGRLDEPVWQTAPAYQLSLSQQDAAGGRTLKEGGEVRLAWDHRYLYVGIKYYDTDILATGDKDNLHHYLLGDVCELFLRPGQACHYWEMYVTPRGNKTAFWFWMRGAEIYVDEKFGLKVAAQLNGTLNNGADRDNYWTAEMAVPVSDLTQYCDPFGPGADWRILVARYNYSHPFKENNPFELSMTPQLSKTSYHLLEEYAVLKVEK